MTCFGPTGPASRSGPGPSERRSSSGDPATAWSTCAPPGPPIAEGDPVIQTVTGSIALDELGLTLPHEHIFINLVREYRGDGLLNDEALLRAELSEFVGSGGRTLIDCTSDDIGRDPEGLRRMSQSLGLNIVMGCGYYRDP